MAFAATKVKSGIMGDRRFEEWSFTELGTDTGGTLTAGITVTSAFVSVNGNFAASISWSGLTVTVGNSAGPTSGRVLLIGY